MAFFSRRGKRLVLPNEIVEAMPADIFLDGELWYSVLFCHEQFLMKVAGLGEATFRKH